MLRLFARQLRTGLRTLLVLTVLLGLIYPLVMVGIGTVLPAQDSSIRNPQGEVVGSSHIAQPVSGPGWFFPRPSAGDYDGLASGASNLGPTNPELLTQIDARRAAIAEREQVDPAAVPPDAVTASGSGLDPDISPAYARIQVARVASQTGLGIEEVTAMVRDNTQEPLLGFIGESGVNVVTLNNDLAHAEARAGITRERIDASAVDASAVSTSAAELTAPAPATDPGR